MLRGLPAQVWLDRADMPADTQPDVIVTDGARGADFQSAQSQNRGADFQSAHDAGPSETRPYGENAGPSETHPYVGLVRIGAVETGSFGPTEVCLPTDVTARELQLACRLLAEIVRLQRQQQAGAELHRRLAAQALTDPLTGLPNRRAWDQVLAERLGRQTRRHVSPRPLGEGTTLCLAILDLDFFKRVNDAHGHAVGDEVLRACGQALRVGLRQDDFVARVGGDEFGLLLWVRDEAAGAATVERVRAGLPGRLAESGGRPVAASAGFCVVPAETSPTPLPCPAAIFAAADAALRTAKQQGRNRTVGPA